MTLGGAIGWLLTACAAAAWSVAFAAPPLVEVVYVDPEKFTDVRDGYTQTPSARDFFLAEIRRYVGRRAAPDLAEGETLKVMVTNIQFAGDYLARRPETTNVRVIREVTPARIDLAFRVLGTGGEVLREGARVLRSTGYPTVPGVDPSDPLLYEKALLADWLRDDVARRTR